jgi:hypothetical protein
MQAVGELLSRWRPKKQCHQSSENMPDKRNLVKNRKQTEQESTVTG